MTEQNRSYPGAHSEDHALSKAHVKDQICGTFRKDINKLRNSNTNCLFFGIMPSSLFYY